ncbi:MAG: hypothetical protein WCD18_04335 [Thermosynechococcaceae cyanobacterium]
MSNQSDRFAGGFIAGAIFGSIVGGLVGTWVASRLNEPETEDEPSVEGSRTNPAREQLKRIRQRVFQVPEDVTIEETRQGLEDKIAQLNDAIDQARQQLSHVNGTSQDP